MVPKLIMLNPQVQSLAKLQQPAVTVRGRKADASAVQSSIEPARAKFAKVYGTEAPSVTMDSDTFLPEAPTGILYTLRASRMRSYVRLRMKTSSFLKCTNDMNAMSALAQITPALQ